VYLQFCALRLRARALGTCATYTEVSPYRVKRTIGFKLDTYQHIKFKIDDRVARITFARPPVNIFNIAMMREINDALNQCGRQRELVAIVFDAAADCRAFSAGVAVEEHVEETIFQMLDSFHAIFRNIEQLARPTIAVVDGAALGGGCELVAACDLAIASERARFGQPEIKLGVFPPVAAVLLPLVIGDKRARELILTGELIEATEAARLGLVNYVLPGNELEQKTSELLAGLRGLSAAALELTKKAIDLGRGRSLDSALKEVEDMYLHELMKTHDANEGINAFIEKRKPEWRDR
jgi:cyclohexa-1,5-dienecarbonyl-CoA hydratase